MMLIAGGNSPVPTGELTVRVIAGKPADVSAFRLQSNGKVAHDADMIFYGQRTCRDKAVSLLSEGTHTTYSLNLTRLSTGVEKVAFSCTCNPGQTVSSLGQLSIQVEQAGQVHIQANVDLQARSEAALILGEFYRRNGQWKFRFVSQGFNGGLKPLAEFYGVVVDEDQTPTPPPASTARSSTTPYQPHQPTPSASPSSSSGNAPSPTINLSKISLTKNNPTINLTKRSDYGLIKVNLNWNRGTHKGNGFLSGIFGASGVDLDLGAFVRFKDGNADIVQALGNRFGHLDHQPYVRLLEDDRTGASHSGEWLHINGDNWRNIAEVLVFAFIYQGVPDWTKTDGVVTITVPNEPPVETRLTEGGRSNGMCAVARLINDNGVLTVQRIDRYFSGHEELDRAFGWGFRWRAGSK